MCKKYLSIDIENNRFIWNRKYVEREIGGKNKPLFSFFIHLRNSRLLPNITYQSLIAQLGFISTMFAFVGSILLLILAVALLLSLILMDDAALN